MALYKDIETGEIITREQLLNEYNSLKEQWPTEYDYSFEWYIHNCLTAFGGTLERL